MIYSVDTCVLLDILLPDPVHGTESRDVLKKASSDGGLVICPIVYAELCPQFASKRTLDAFLSEAGIHVHTFSREMLWLAGNAWRSYLKKGGKRKERIIPDFLIGTFTKEKAQRIITRDRDFYKEHFDLVVFYG